MRSTFMISLVAIVLSAVILGVIPRANDAAVFGELLDRAGFSRKALCRTKQQRKNILKESWVGKKYLYLTAKDSELYLMPHDNDAIEELAEVKTSLAMDANDIKESSEKIFFGHKARLYYKTRTLSASGVQFVDETTKNGLKSRQMSGTADRVELTLKDQTIDVIAHGLQADLKSHVLAK